MDRTDWLDETRRARTYSRMEPEPRRGGPSPWGPIQAAVEIVDGLVDVTTGGHGGFWLTAEKRMKMPGPLGAVATYAGGNWYEEDEDAALVILAFPEHFGGQAVWTLLGGMSYRWCRTEIRRAVQAWRGASRDRAQEIADLWYVEHHDWWIPAAPSPTVTGGRSPSSRWAPATAPCASAPTSNTRAVTAP